MTTKGPKETLLQSLSRAQGGYGDTLRQTNTFGTIGSAVSLGQSPGPGTGCTLFLSNGNDTAFQNAILDFYVMQFGKEALFQSIQITPDQALQNATLEFTVTGCAADFWEVRITFPSSVPANSVNSSILAFGVENFTGATASSTNPSYTAQAGPGVSGFATFPEIATGTNVFLATCCMKVITAGGGAEAAGDSYTDSVILAWKNVGGVVTALPPVVTAPTTYSDASMTTSDFGPQTVSGGQAAIPFTTPTLDAGSVVQVTVNLLPLALV